MNLYYVVMGGSWGNSIEIFKTKKEVRKFLEKEGDLDLSAVIRGKEIDLKEFLSGNKK